MCKSKGLWKVLLWQTQMFVFQRSAEGSYLFSFLLVWSHVAIWWVCWELICFTLQWQNACLASFLDTTGDSSYLGRLENGISHKHFHVIHSLDCESMRGNCYTVHESLHNSNIIFILLHESTIFLIYLYGLWGLEIFNGTKIASHFTILSANLHN